MMNLDPENLEVVLLENRSWLALWFVFNKGKKPTLRAVVPDCTRRNVTIEQLASLGKP